MVAQNDGRFAEKFGASRAGRKTYEYIDDLLSGLLFIGRPATQ